MITEIVILGSSKENRIKNQPAPKVLCNKHATIISYLMHVLLLLLNCKLNTNRLLIGHGAAPKFKNSTVRYRKTLNILH